MDYEMDEDIVETLESLFDFKISLKEFKACKAEHVKAIYFHFLRELGVNLEVINVFPMEAPEAMIQYPEMCQEITRTMRMTEIISSIFHQAFQDNSFMPVDLFQPDRRKTKMYISMFLKLVFSMNDHAERLNEQDTELNMKAEQKMKMQNKLRVLTETLEVARLENIESRSHREKVHEKNEELKKSLNELVEKSGKVRNELENLKVQKATILTSVKKTELEVLELKESVKELANQVIQAEEREVYQERESKLASLRQQLKIKKNTIGDLHGSLATMNSVSRCLKQFVALQQEVQQQIEKKSECVTAIMQLEQERAAMVEETEDDNIQGQQLTERLASRSAKDLQLHHAWKLKQEAILEEMKEHKVSIEEIWRNQTESEIAYQDIEKERLKIVQEREQVMEELISHAQVVADNYRMLLDALATNSGAMKETFAANLDMVLSCQPARDT